MKTSFILLPTILAVSLGAAEGNPKALVPALTAEQKSYQALLRLQAHEFEVSRQNQNQSSYGERKRKNTIHYHFAKYGPHRK